MDDPVPACSRPWVDSEDLHGCRRYCGPSDVRSSRGERPRRYAAVVSSPGPGGEALGGRGDLRWSIDARAACTAEAARRSESGRPVSPMSSSSSAYSANASASTWTSSAISSGTLSANSSNASDVFGQSSPDPPDEGLAKRRRRRRRGADSPRTRESERSSCRVGLRVVGRLRRLVGRGLIGGLRIRDHGVGVVARLVVSSAAASGSEPRASAATAAAIVNQRMKVSSLVGAKAVLHGARA